MLCVGGGVYSTKKMAAMTNLRGGGAKLGTCRKYLREAIYIDTLFAQLSEMSFIKISLQNSSLKSVPYKLYPI